jgi:hypothetical protein
MKLLSGARTAGEAAVGGEGSKKKNKLNQKKSKPVLKKPPSKSNSNAELSNRAKRKLLNGLLTLQPSYSLQGD